jgi:hypothetical protein
LLGIDSGSDATFEFVGVFGPSSRDEHGQPPRKAAPWQTTHDRAAVHATNAHKFVRNAYHLTAANLFATRSVFARKPEHPKAIVRMTDREAPGCGTTS